MRTLTITLIALLGALALVGAAQAKGPFSIEISGGDLTGPVTIEGPVPTEVVFTTDHISVPAPKDLEPVYILTLTEPDGGDHEFIMTMSYFPGEGDEPGILRGEWDEKNSYFRASAKFESMLDDAISSANGGGDDSTALAWYLIPAAAAGIVLAGGLAGRRLLHSIH